jgi:hypothetical protein
MRALHPGADLVLSPYEGPLKPQRRPLTNVNGIEKKKKEV